MHFKHFNNLIVALFFVAVFAGLMSAYTGASFRVIASVLFLASCLLSFVPHQSGVLKAGLLKEVWSGVVLKFLTTALKNSWIQGIPDYSRYVSAVGNEAQVIHLASMNVLPDVLLNNTTYPIPIQDLPLTDIPIALDKFITKRTPITDDEAYASSVNKIQLVAERHAQAVMIMYLKKGVHALAPSGNTAAMPVLKTTGAEYNGRLRLIWEDIAAFKTQLDDLGIPEENRRLVLCNDHVNDLIVTDKDFKALFYNRTTGTLFNQLSFEIDSYVNNPYYNPTTLTKLSFGAVPTATDQKASVFFSLDRAAMANGWTKIYHDLPDTEYQRHILNVRQYGIILPTAEEARGAIVSDNAA